MKIDKEYIIIIIVLVILLASGGGVYQFYYKDRLTAFKTNQAQVAALESKLKALETKFEGSDGRVYDPKKLISATRGKIQPIIDEIVRWASFFNTSDFMEIDTIPEGVMLKFYYEEQYNKVLADLRQRATCPYPESDFGVPDPKDFQQHPMKRPEIERSLRMMHFGCSMVRMMMTAKAQSISAIEVWPPRRGYNELVTVRTTGLAFTMTLTNLVAFLESLRMNDRYFTVDAMSILNRSLRVGPGEPVLEIRMLLTQGDFVLAKATSGGTGTGAPPAAGAAPGGGPAPATALAQQGMTPRKSKEETGPPPSTWQKFKKWMREKGIFY